MSYLHNGGSFFPLIGSNQYHDEPGADVRTVIAMHIMAGRRAAHAGCDSDKLAEASVRDADALIKELEI